MPKAKTANFTLRKIVTGVPAHLAAHRFAALQRSGQYSELRFIQRGKSKFDIVGYRWPDKGLRRKYGVGGARKNPSSDADFRRAAAACGCRFEGWQEQPKGRPAKAQFALLDPGAESSFYAKSPADVSIQAARKRAEYRAARNPSEVGAATPNQVRFGSRGRTLVGWIDRETPTRYQISYKSGARLRQVWRRKDKVLFVVSGKRGRVVNPCPKEANPGAALSRAVEVSKRFHGFDPRSVKQVNLKWPKALACLGACVRLDYLCDKFDGKPRIYFHEFKGPCAVYAADSSQADGSSLLIIHGNFKIKPAGITG